MQKSAVFSFKPPPPKSLQVNGCDKLRGRGGRLRQGYRGTSLIRKKITPPMHRPTARSSGGIFFFSVRHSCRHMTEEGVAGILPGSVCFLHSFVESEGTFSRERFLWGLTSKKEGGDPLVRWCVVLQLQRLLHPPGNTSKPASEAWPTDPFRPNYPFSFLCQPFSVIRDSPSWKARSPRQFECPTRQFESVATPPTTSVPRSSNVVGKHGAQGCWLHPLQKPECVVSRLHAGVPCS